jgi:fermentation-respiration switch protein FrsA (DUF1100 family)
MANGYGAEYRFGLLGFAEKFALAGMATMLFDYRGFGQSEGEPRQLIDPAMQLEDWRAAMMFVRQYRGINGKRIALWGSSFAGGHVISLAAKDHTVKAVVAQVPHLCTKAAFKMVGLRHGLRGTAHAVYDVLREKSNLSPHTIPIVAESNEYGVMNHPGWRADYTKLAPDNTQWQNATPARSLLRCGTYSPINSAQEIRCPVLVVYAEKDQGVPIAPILDLQKKVAKAEVKYVPGDHFDVYTGNKAHEQVAQWQLEFLLQHL